MEVSTDIHTAPSEVNGALESNNPEFGAMDIDMDIDIGVEPEEDAPEAEAMAMVRLSLILIHRSTTYPKSGTANKRRGLVAHQWHTRNIPRA